MKYIIFGFFYWDLRLILTLFQLHHGDSSLIPDPSIILRATESEITRFIGYSFFGMLVLVLFLLRINEELELVLFLFSSTVY